MEKSSSVHGKARPMPSLNPLAIPVDIKHTLDLMEHEIRITTEGKKIQTSELCSAG